MTSDRPPVATGSVDTGHRGRTELRIHGVGGTTPESLLDHPHPIQVAGDTTSGFFRRWDPDGSEPPAGPKTHVEGYCWGGLTSRSAIRALWLLLLPFLLVNVAHWALPGRASKRRWANTGAQRALRLLALSLTGTLSLGAAEVGVDLVARQCGATACFNSAPSWIGALRTHQQVLVALGSLLPLAVLGLVAWLGRQTWRNYEQIRPADSLALDSDSALAHPAFWSGEEPVARLHSLHLAIGLSAAASVQVLPALDGDHSGLAWALVAAVGVVAAISAVTTVGDGVARPHHRAPSSRDRSAYAWVLAIVAGLALTGAIVIDLLPHAIPLQNAHPTSLPRLDGLVQGVLAAQAATIVVLIGLTAAARLDPDAGDDRRRRNDQLIGPALAIAAWATAWLFTSGVSVRFARQLLNDPKHAVPTSYTVGGALIGPAVAALFLGPVTGTILWYRRELGRQATRVSELPPPAGPDPAQPDGARIRQLAATRARAGLLDLLPFLGTISALAAGCLALVSLLIDRIWNQVGGWAYVRDLADLGTVLLGLAIASLVGFGAHAFRNTGTRRTLGILWDLGTFWPRAAHPWAPPSYGERALPQLQTRLGYLAARPDDHVIVAGHSQGSVVAAALLLMPTSEQTRGRLSLVTYGSPLGRIYTRAFPGYLGRQVLGCGDRATETTTASSARQPTVVTQAAAWRNLYRATDPIGGYVSTAVDEGGAESGVFGPASARSEGPIDILLVDPVFAVPPGDKFAQPAAAHSHYRDDPTYAFTIDML